MMGNLVVSGDGRENENGGAALVPLGSSGALMPAGEGGVGEEALFWFVNFTSGRTKEAYGVAVRSFAQFLGVQRAEDVQNARQGDVLRWREAMLASGASPRTVNARLSALSSL